VSAWEVVDLLALLYACGFVFAGTIGLISVRKLSQDWPDVVVLALLWPLLPVAMYRGWR